MKVLIADDHPMVRDALSRAVRSVVPGAQLTEARDYREVELRLREQPDLLLLDIHMPGMYGLAGVHRLRAAFPAQRIMVASGDDDPATIRSVLATGVVGFLPKCEPPDVLMHALQRVLSGGGFTPAQALADSRQVQPPPLTDAAALTVRRLEVLRLLMQGQPNNLIARALGLTEGTVKIHIAAILRALQSRNRTEAVVVARRLGIEG